VITHLHKTNATANATLGTRASQLFVVQTLVTTFEVTASMPGKTALGGSILPGSTSYKTRKAPMVCDTRARVRGQTLTERKAEVKSAVDKLAALLAANKVTAKVGPQGAVTFTNWENPERSFVSDACAYRMLMATGSAAVKMALARAEALAGRPVNKQALAQGVHSHDGGTTWHKGH
jgi:4-hydroxy-L-threonine phosphate dehydrogenase PdxA